MLGSTMVVKLAVVLGLLLLVIGIGTRNSNVALAGAFIFSGAFIWGGLSSGEENLSLRITMLAIGGLFAIGAFASLSGITSLVTGLR